MPTYDACLIDVFETVLCVDQLRHAALLAERAGVDADDFAAAAGSWGQRVSDGAASMPEAMAAVLRECGAPADRATVDDLVAADLELLVELAQVPPDTVPFLQELRARGVRTAFVSNCSPNARELLARLGLAPLVDELVLSCEVGATKPDPRIFRVALERLGVAAERALLVDDLADYCAVATRLGLGAVRIDRGGDAGDVATLAEVTPYVLATA